MLDRTIKPLIDRVLDPAGPWFQAQGISGEWLSLLSFFLGLAAALAVGLGFFDLALGFIILNRIFDGFNGALGRAQEETAFARYLDIVFNFIFYGAVALGFGFFDPNGQALTAAILIFAYLGLGGTTLAYAVMAKDIGLDGDVSENLWVDTLSELVGTSEMTVALLVMVLLHQYFGAIALVFALFCLVATSFRIIKAWLALR